MIHGVADDSSSELLLEFWEQHDHVPQIMKYVTNQDSYEKQGKLWVSGRLNFPSISQIYKDNHFQSFYMFF